MLGWAIEGSAFQHTRTVRGRPTFASGGPSLANVGKDKLGAPRSALLLG
jgi:hypothetical protein